MPRTRGYVPPAKTIIIIGGGVGGLTIAAKLAIDGHNVTIYEKNSQVGGRCSTFYHKNQDEDQNKAQNEDQNQNSKYKFEQGAILYLFHDVYKEVFQKLGTKLEDEVTLNNKVDHHQIFIDDDKKFKYSIGADSFAKSIKEFAPNSNDYKNLEYFCTHYKYVQEFVTNNVFLATYDTFWDFLRFLWNAVVNNFSILWTALRYTMYGNISRYFEDETVRQVLTFQSLYFGILTSYEVNTGLKYPAGGLGAISDALKRIAERTKKVQIVTNKGVNKILVENGKAIGVELDDGTTDEAAIVISDADLTYTYKVLLKDQPECYKRANELAKKNHVPSTITFFWGMKKKIEGLEAHNIFLPKDYKKVFEDIHVHKKIPDDPAFFIHIANRMDENMAPENMDALTVIVPIGEMATPETRGNFKAKVAIVREKVIQRLQKKLNIEDFDSCIHKEFETTTPDTWRDQFNCWQGNIVGTSHMLDNLLYFRPRQKCKEISSLYFVGASTQPGAGVPLVMCSALNLANLINKELTSTARPMNLKKYSKNE